MGAVVVVVFLALLGFVVACVEEIGIVASPPPKGTTNCPFTLARTPIQYPHNKVISSACFASGYSDVRVPD